MRVRMFSETDLELSEFGSGGLEVESDDPALPFSALQMFAVSMGLCTFSILAAYSEQIGADTDDIRIRLTWDYAAQPLRIGSIDMDVHWPQLPTSRLEAARRVAGQCTLHNTLHHPPAIHTGVRQ